MNFTVDSVVNKKKELPFIIQPNNYNHCPSTWFTENNELIFKQLEKSPAILFRGFGIDNPQEFEKFIGTMIPNLYGLYGDLPRLEGSKKIYHSTPYPNDKPILFHNESSHMQKWPRKQWFFCVQPSEIGGCTPIVDCRDMYNILPKNIIEILESKKLLYVRTFNEGLDVSWQDFFKTDSIEQVKQQCLEDGSEFILLPCGTIQIKTLAQAIVTPPNTSRKSFFNQIQLHHPYWLDKDVREILTELYGNERLPRNVYFGDGTVIPDDILADINDAYSKLAIRFQWQQGDVLMVDNMLVAHGRDEFEGDRKIAVAMGEMVNRNDVF